MDDDIETVVDSLAQPSRGMRYFVGYADRAGLLTNRYSDAVQIAETSGAEFVQDRFGARPVVWPPYAERPAL